MICYDVKGDDLLYSESSPRGGEFFYIVDHPGGKICYGGWSTIWQRYNEIVYKIAFSLYSPLLSIGYFEMGMSDIYLPGSKYRIERRKE